MHPRHAAVLTVAWLAIGGGAASAQAPAAAATREETIAEAQRAKATVLAPYVPGRAEALFQRFEERGFPFLGTPPGFYPALGSVYAGGGLAFGGGYRQFTGYRSLVDLHGLISIRNYKRLEATFRSPGHARGRFEFGVNGGWLDAPRITFFGIGPESSRDDRAVFRLRQRYLDAAISWRPVRWLQINGGAGYEHYDEDSGTGPLRSIETVFDAASAPHLGEDPAFVKLTTAATWLWLKSPAYSRAGGFARWTYTGYQRTNDDGAFGLSRTEIVQHIPILRENWVISLRARAESVVGDEGDAPYFLLPALGSGTTLRAFQTNRFRDRQSLLVSGEWRWVPSRLALDLALFADAGAVGADWPDVANRRLRKDYGIGIRFHAPEATALRIDLARGDEGLRLVFTSSTPF